MSSARLASAGLLLAGLMLAGPAWAQQVEQQQEAQEPEYDSSEQEFEPTFGYRGSVSFFGGQISSGNPIATVVNPFFNTTFETGDDTAWGVRGVYRIWWRLAAEAEYGTASPGIQAILSNPRGEERTEFFFGDLDVSYIAGSVRFDLADSFVDPFLSVGIGGVSFTGEDEVGNTNLGLLFGGGVEVPVYNGFFGRFDVRGLRADVEAASLPRNLVEGQEQDAVSTQVIWTIGLGYRF